MLNSILYFCNFKFVVSGESILDIIFPILCPFNTLSPKLTVLFKVIVPFISDDIKNQIINKNIIKNQLNEQIYLLDQAKLDRIRALQLKEEGLFHQNAMKDYDLRLKQNNERVKIPHEIYQKYLTTIWI